MDNLHSSPMCTLPRDTDTLRRYFAVMTWLLKLITIIFFFATIRFEAQRARERAERAAEDAERRPEDGGRRRRRVAYRHVNRDSQHG